MDSLMDLFFANADPKNWSTPARTLIETLQGVTDPINEKNFSDEELEFIKKLIKSKNNPNGNISYGDYMKYSQSPGTGMVTSAFPGLASLFDPFGRVQTTLGRFGYSTDPAGNVKVTDKYDFNPIGQYDGVLGKLELMDQSGWSPYGLIRDYAGRKLPPGTGRPVNINLGKF